MEPVTGWEVTEWSIAIASTLTAAGVIWRKGIRPFVAFVRRFKAWMDRVEASLSWTETQMRPNGGSSLTDKVNKLSDDVAMLLRHDAERDRHGARYGSNDPSDEEEPHVR